MFENEIFMSFIHLHNHSHYSLLEWLPKPVDYAKKAKELGMEAVALTDTSNVYGAHEFYKACLYEGVKPILWTEIYLKWSSAGKIYHKIVLLAKSFSGYQNIIQLVSKANLERPWVYPYITFWELKEHSQDLICLSGPISWEIPFLILAGKSDEEIIEKIQQYQEVFWDDFYVELLYHDDIPKQKLVTDSLIALHKKHTFQVVAANNCYYIEKEDKQTQDIIMALGTGHQIENPDRPTLINGDYCFAPASEMFSLFWFLPESLLNTKKIADKVDIKIPIGQILIPTFQLPDQDQLIYEKTLQIDSLEPRFKKLTSDEWYLRYQTFLWLNWRYHTDFSKEDIFHLVRKLDKPWLQKSLTESSPEELKALSLTFYSDEKRHFLSQLSDDLKSKIERIEYELSVVHEMWFDAYFLIVADYINWARKNDIPVWPWRGSAAGSLMAYLTWITDIDPLPYWLLFERFLNPARISMPDIDTDFADDGRDRVIEYCRNKYGDDHVAQICTFGTFAARAALKDVGRVMGLDFQEMNQLAKLIPEKPGTKLSDALEESLEFKNAYQTNKLYRTLIDNALKIEGNVRQVGVHACAVIIAPKPMTEYTALSHPPKDQNIIITQYSAYPLEDLGLLKMDFLGLKNLSIIQRTLKIIKNNKKIDIDISSIPLDDPKVFEIFSNWDTTGVFQFESDGMRKYLIDLEPNSFEDLIAMVSLYRPWPLAYIPDFIDRKHGVQEVKYLTDPLYDILKSAWYSEDDILIEKQRLTSDLSWILDVSYGIAVYQEQLMFIVQSMAWFSLWEADLLRRWVGKKKKEIIEQLKVEFIKRSVTYRWYKPETPEYIYTEMIQPAANYSFNKSHAACYAFIAYQTAYLKAYYKAEFLTSLMVSDEENIERIAMEVWECNLAGIEVLPPSVEQSMKHFTYIDDSTIRYWLKAIKWIGDGPILAIKHWRWEESYQSLEDFIKKTGREVINKKTLESLILSWSLDVFGERGRLFKNIENMILYLKKSEKQSLTSQIGLFDWIAGENSIELTEVAPFNFEEIITGEKLVIWLPISGHPLDGLSKYIKKRSQNSHFLKMSIEELEKKLTPKQNLSLQTIWYIKDIRKMITKWWKQMMFLYCESFEYDFEVTIFHKDYDTWKDKVQLDHFIIVSGNLSVNAEYKRKSILARDIKIISLTQVREQAKSMGLFDNKKYQISKKWFVQNTQDENQDNSHTFSGDWTWEGDEWEEVESILPPQDIQRQYCIMIPPHAPKGCLIQLKDIMIQLPPWNIEIWLDLKWQKINTKISVAKLDKIYDFEEKYLKPFFVK